LEGGAEGFEGEGGGVLFARGEAAEGVCDVCAGEAGGLFGREPF
jgi:hypothetical protein